MSNLTATISTFRLSGLNMSQNADIYLQEEPPAGHGSPRLSGTEHDVPNFDQLDSRQWESHRKRACVLIGSAILQLPIWGKFNPEV